MEIDPETKGRIFDTVMEILRSADLDQTNEYEVRTMAAERLATDLSTAEHRQLVRHLVESFLLSTGQDLIDGPTAVGEETKENCGPVEQSAEPPAADTDIFICKMSKKRKVVIQDWKGSKIVSFREFYFKNGKEVVKDKGISLTTKQWSAFRNNLPAIEEAIVEMKSRIRSSEVVRNQDNDGPSLVTGSTTKRLVHIKTIRLDEKNYFCWAQHMESFLNQLNIGYVLKDPCPSIIPRPGATAEEISRTKASQQKWVNDDYICHHNILNSVSDHLYDWYSKRFGSARELWDDLKLFCLSEHVTKRSQVRKYIEFQMVEEVSVLEQVQELNKIADAIAAGGMFVNEDFHVSAIISKLPASWSNCRMRLMCEEHLPFCMMMDCLRAEEESRTIKKRELSSTEPRAEGSHVLKYLGTSGNGNCLDVKNRFRPNSQRSWVWRPGHKPKHRLGMGRGAD